MDDTALEMDAPAGVKERHQMTAGALLTTGRASSR